MKGTPTPYQRVLWGWESQPRSDQRLASSRLSASDSFVLVGDQLHSVGRFGTISVSMASLSGSALKASDACQKI